MCDHDQQRLRRLGVLDENQSTLYEFDNPMTATNDTDDTNDTDEQHRDILDIDTDEFWTFDQFESEADAHATAADYHTAFTGHDQ